MPGPSDLTNIFSSFGRQQDAHEFLTDLLNLINEDMISVIRSFLEELDRTRNPPPPPSSSSSPKVQNHHIIGNVKGGGASAFPSSSSSSSSSVSPPPSSSSSTDSSSKYEKAAEKLSFIGQHFESTVENSFRCLHCDHRREPKEEVYRVFSIDIEYGDNPFHGQDPATSHDDVDGDAIIDLRDEQDIVIDQLLEKERQQKLSIELATIFGHFFNDEIRELVCEMCGNEGGQVLISSELVSVPSMLVIHLKRFKYEDASQTYVKVNKPVSFPMELNLLECGGCIKRPDEVLQANSESGTEFWKSMSPQEQRAYLEERYVSSLPLDGDAGHSEKDCVRRPQEASMSRFSYSLRAVVRHIGKELLTGHYICDVLEETAGKDENGFQAQTQGDRVWKRFDDSFVTRIDQVTIGWINASLHHL